MSEPTRYLVTSALPYANGPLHIGQIAGAYLPADIYARYLRLRGKDVVYICGSDEHGAAITLRAKKEGITPKAIVDKFHEHIKNTFEEFGMSFDIYHRTSSELHHQTASDFFKVLYEKGEFEQKTTEQYFDEEHSQFLADRYISGTCPKCDYDSAYGDQCEKCGSALSPKELINPRSTLSGNQPVLRKTKHWYLPLNKYEEWLKEWIIEGHKDDWKTNVYGQCKSWLEAGLKSRAMTRDLDWGVKVPLEDAKGKVLYVWLDAPIGYISATKQWAQDKGKSWEDYWKPARLGSGGKEDTKLVHFIGKDNIVFHCIIFPILLKAHGGFILPENVPANEFLNLEGDKISTSRNHAVWLHEYLEDFPGKQDELRYVLCSIAPETKDSEFTWKDYQARVNNELVAIYGNFVNRALVLIHKYFNGKVPEAGNLGEGELAVKAEMTAIIKKIEESIENFRFREALAGAMNVARLGNQYLADSEPWHLIKTDEAKVKTILNIAVQIVANLTVVMKPFLPFSSKKLEKLLNIKAVGWKMTGNDLLSPGHQLNKPELLFGKIEDEAIEAQIARLQSPEDMEQGSEVK